MKLKNAYLKRVQPTEFDAALLERLCREGKVFVYLEPEKNIDMYRREVLNYVQKINDYVFDDWNEVVMTSNSINCFQGFCFHKNPEAIIFNIHNSKLIKNADKDFKSGTSGRGL